MADAQSVIARLSVQNDRISREQARIEAQEKEAPSQPAPQPAQTVAQPQPQIDPRAEKWANDNEWFGKSCSRRKSGEYSKTSAYG